MTLSSVRCLKLEAPGPEGGTTLDFCPTETNPLLDAMTCAGIFVCGPSATAADKTVLLDRINGSLRLTDQFATHVLSEIVSSVTGESGSHNALLDVIHFLPEGPGDGWPSGACQVLTMNGPVPASKIWYTSTALAKKIFGIVYTYNGPLLAQAQMVLYAADGATPVRTVTDVYTYSGPISMGCTRSWS